MITNTNQIAAPEAATGQKVQQSSRVSTHTTRASVKSHSFLSHRALAGWLAACLSSIGLVQSREPFFWGRNCVTFYHLNIDVPHEIQPSHCIIVATTQARWIL